MDDFPLFYLFAFVLAGFCIYYLPVFDFRPYHIGVNLPRAMVVPEGEEEPEYLTTFVLEKDGVKKEFTTEDYPRTRPGILWRAGRCW